MVRTNPIKQRYGKTPPKGNTVPMTSDHYNKDIKSIFKVDSAKNIADKLLGNRQGDPNMVGGSGALGLIGGVLGRTVKTFANAAKQYMRGSKVGKSVSNFKPLVTGNKVHDTKSVNKAFETRFNTATPTPPKPTKTVTDGWGNTAEGVARGANVGAKPLTTVQKALVNQKDIIKNSTPQL
tara:strand:- start:959 stop:1498 length:540 start_codon:yes stop_codon:yes gene_type:complete